MAKRRPSFKRKPKSSFKKRKTFRRKTNTKFKTNVSVGKGFPKKMTMTHKYCELITLVANTGAVAKHLFSCNGLFDPNTTGSGHQPMYYDQMSLVYNHYTVIGSKIKISCVNVNGPSVSPAFWVSLAQNDDSTVTYQNLATQAEQSDGQTRLSPAGATSLPRMTSKWSAKKTFGGSVLANDNLQGSVGTNPAEQTFWVLCTQAVDGFSSVTMDVRIDIEYIAVWDEIRDVAPS